MSEYTFFLYINQEKSNLINKDNLTVEYKNNSTNNLLNNLYSANEPSWKHNISSEIYEYIYVKFNNNIVATVRINLNIKELDYGFVLKEHRYNKTKPYDLYQELCNRRVQYITDNYIDRFVLYTKHDRLTLIQKHINSGLTLINPTNYKTVIPNDEDRNPYWQFEVNRPLKDLIVKLNYSIQGSICSGIQIADNIIYTAGHCVRHPDRNTAADVNADPISIIYNKRNSQLQTSNIIKTNSFGYDGTVELDKGIVIHDKPFVSASNVFILSNPEDLPDDFELICFCQQTCFNQRDFGKRIKIVKNINRNNFQEILNDEEYLNFLGTFRNEGDFLELLDYSDDDQFNKSITDLLYKKYTIFKEDTNSFVPGDSGGPFGFFFGPNNKFFALVGTISFTAAGKYQFMINASASIKSIRDSETEINISSSNLKLTIKKPKTVIYTNGDTQHFLESEKKYKYTIVNNPTSQVVNNPTAQVVNNPTAQVVYNPTPQVVNNPTAQVVNNPTAHIPTPRVVNNTTPQVVNLTQKLKPNTIILLSTIIPYLFYKEELKDFDIVTSVLTLVIVELISPDKENIFDTVSNFVKTLIYSNKILSGGSKNTINSWNNYINKIIEQVTINLTQWYMSNDHSIENLKSIIKLNSSKKLIKYEYIKDFEHHLDKLEHLKTNKYYKNLLELLNSTNTKLSPDLINKILKLILNKQKVEKLIDDQFIKITEYTKILAGLKSDKICNIYDLNINGITEQTMSNCINDYKKLIKKKSQIDFKLNLIQQIR